jgi:putative oxidoreductase
MSTNFMSDLVHGDRADDRIHTEALAWIAPLGRVLFALIFIMSAMGHFSGKLVPYAAAAGVPMAQIAVPVAGMLALLGGISVLLGWQTRIGALMLVLFLVPVTLFMHRFWGLPDAQMAQMQQVNFLKNLALLGGALLLFYFGPGPMSLDHPRARPGHP